MKLAKKVIINSKPNHPIFKLIKSQRIKAAEAAAESTASWMTQGYLN